MEYCYMIRYKPFEKEELQRLVDESSSYSEILIKSGRVNTGGNYTTLRSAIKKFQIDTSGLVARRA